jgi:predicted nucleic acid-binding protein
MEKEIVSNASSLVFIGKAQMFDLMKNLYNKVFIPKEVVKEIFEFKKPENPIIKQEINLGFIKEFKVKNIKNFPIDIGEKAAISLCLEKNIFVFLSDDKKARKYARSLKIKTIGVLGIILKNLKLKKINKKKAKRLIQRLIKKGFYMSSELYSEVLDVIDSY